MAAALIRFGSHVFDLATQVLRRGGQRCALQSQPAQLLVLLIERAGELVTGEQIRERLWSDTVVEYDQSINFAVRRIRVALGPDADMLQTVPRKGYRFAGEVTRTVVDRPQLTRRSAAVAAALLVALASGFGAGIVLRDAPVGQFVYDHLVHPDRCPYMRVFFPAHWNS